MEDVTVEADNAANPTPVVVASVPSLIMLETWNQTMMESEEGKQQPRTEVVSVFKVLYKPYCPGEDF